jgi:hypothetical protein
MAVVLGRRVVVVVDVRADAVHQRGEQRVEPLGASEHARRGRSGERTERAQRDVDRFVAGAAERAADVVDQRAQRFVVHVVRNGFEAALDEPGGKRPGL